MSKQAKPELHRFPDVTDVPLVVYRGVLNGSAGECEALFEQHGWGGGWRAGIFPYHHFHAETHEVLGMIRGEAEVRFGGSDGPVVSVRAGDVVIIPAGVAHCREKGEVMCVGAYPEGYQPDMNRGAPEPGDGTAARIARVPRPPADPVYGRSGQFARGS